MGMVGVIDVVEAGIVLAVVISNNVVVVVVFVGVRNS